MKYGYLKFHAYNSFVYYLNSELYRQSGWDIQHWQDTGGSIKVIFKQNQKYSTLPLPDKS